jgi:UDP-N-acetylglucosamine 2-epimerase (non-hydrolysing)
MTGVADARRVAVVLGTRPEIIKLAPVIARLGRTALVVHTGQHFDDNMSRSFLQHLEIGEPDLHLAIGGTTRGAQIGQATTAIERFLLQRRPSAVLVQGDTNSALAGAIAANATGTPLAHLEAGLRSYDRQMPEEHNRVVIDTLADLCLAPHHSNADALRREGIDASRIRMVGSTLPDALATIMPSAAERQDLLAAHGLHTAGFVLATIHRVENADNPDNLAAILGQLAELPVPVILPLHPRTRERAEAFELTSLVNRLQIREPMRYREFVALAKECAVMVSDSGGVQEEAAIVKRPVVVVRRSTERPELLGTFAHLVGAGPQIGATIVPLLERITELHAELESLPYPYGEGGSDNAVAALLELAG